MMRVFYFYGLGGPPLKKSERRCVESVPCSDRSCT